MGISRRRNPESIRMRGTYLKETIQGLWYTHMSGILNCCILRVMYYEIYVVFHMIDPLMHALSKCCQMVSAKVYSSYIVD